MEKSKLVNLRVDVLWEFREFKRDEIPAPHIGYLESRGVSEVTDYITSQGTIAPLELSVIGT